MPTPAQAPPRHRYNPDVYHERRSPSPLADVSLDIVATNYELLKQQERLLAEAELTRRFMERVNRLHGTLSLLVQAIETGNDRRTKKTGPAAGTAAPASPGEPS